MTKQYRLSVSFQSFFGGVMEWRYVTILETNEPGSVIPVI